MKDKYLKLTKEQFIQIMTVNTCSILAMSGLETTYSIEGVRMGIESVLNDMLNKSKEHSNDN